MGLFDMVDSLIKNTCCDIVKPKAGSVVKTRLMGGFDHTGIYLGKDKIVELCGDGDIRIVSHKKFIKGDDDSLARMGIYISHAHRMITGTAMHLQLRILLAVLVNPLEKHGIIILFLKIVICLRNTALMENAMEDAFLSAWSRLCRRSSILHLLIPCSVCGAPPALHLTIEKNLMYTGF